MKGKQNVALQELVGLECTDETKMDEFIEHFMKLAKLAGESSNDQLLTGLLIARLNTFPVYESMVQAFQNLPEDEQRAEKLYEMIERTSGNRKNNMNLSKNARPKMANVMFGQPPNMQNYEERTMYDEYGNAMQALVMAQPAKGKSKDKGKGKKNQRIHWFAHCKSGYFLWWWGLPFGQFFCGIV